MRSQAEGSLGNSPQRECGLKQAADREQEGAVAERPQDEKWGGGK